jgi:hypothetical protein
MPTGTVVDGLVDPLLAFNLGHPGFAAILAEPDPSAGWARAVQRLHETLDERLDRAVEALRPDLDPTARRVRREVCTLAFKAVTAHILAGGEQPAARYTAELKRMLTAYPQV